MRILLFEENEIQRQAAAVLLKNHYVTIVSTYEEAQRHLMPVINQKQANKLLAQAGFEKFRPWEATPEQKKDYIKTCADITKQATMLPPYDVFITDLLVSVLGPHDEKKMPLGTTLVLLALAQGIKKVAIMPNPNYPKHPAYAAFFCFPHSAFTIGESKVICASFMTACDAVTFQELSWQYLNSEEGRFQYPNRQGTIVAKAWHKILERLDGDVSQEQVQRNRIPQSAISI